jgi:ketosteroid isomerase-like protein
MPPILASVLALSLPFVLHPALAQTTDPTKILEQRYSDWMSAFRRGDGAAMDKMEADGLTLIFPEGTIWTKQQPRAEEMKGRGPIPYTHTLEQVRARVHGEVAVLTGFQNDVNAKDGSKSRSSFTTVWKREGGEWKVWSAHWSVTSEKK